MASLLPIWDGNVLVDGSYIHATQNCLSKSKCDKCKEHYDMLKNQQTGFYMCPYGMSSYVYQTGTITKIYTGLRVRGYYKKKNDGKNNSIIYNPIIDPDNIVSLIQSIAIKDAKIEMVDELLHETRKLNGQIKNLCDLVFENSTDDENFNPIDMNITIKNIHVCSYMIYNRFSYFDTVVNPKLYMGEPFESTVFKKFDKMRKLMRDYLKKGVRISLQPNCYFQYRIYPSFETLLFILFENAIKYSPANEMINVFFNEKDEDCLNVRIESIGPYADENELLHLTDKGYRGENAKLIDKSGQGFGLSFAKVLCDIHRINIHFDCEYLKKDHGIKYGKFMILLDFNKKKCDYQTK